MFGWVANDSVWDWKSKGWLLDMRLKKPVNGYWTADGSDLAIIVSFMIQGG